MRCLLGHFDWQLHDATDLRLFDTAGVFPSMIAFIDASTDVCTSNNDGNATLKMTGEEDDWF